MNEAIVAAAMYALEALALPWFPAGTNPETRAETRARHEQITRATVREVEAVLADHPDFTARAGVGPWTLTALALIQAYQESALSYEAHSGVPIEGRPAPFGDRGRARCLHQMQISAARVPFAAWRPFEAPEWATLHGLDDAATGRCVRAGVRTLAYHAWRCRARSALERGDANYRVAIIFTETKLPSRGGRCGDRASSDGLRRAFAFQGFIGRMLSWKRREEKSGGYAPPSPAVLADGDVRPRGAEEKKGAEEKSMRKKGEKK